MSRKLMQHLHEFFPLSNSPFPLFGEKGGVFLFNSFEESSGLSISEDEKYVYIEAYVPGIKSEEIELSLNQGILWIKAIKKEEIKDNKKKFYRKATSSFSYSIPLPSAVDETKTPEAICKNGIVKIKFNKQKIQPSKKISVRVL
jgi:HSP20 family protein